jgi:hypothetical protein
MLSFTERLFLRIQYDPDEEALVGLNPGVNDLITAAGLLVNLMLDNRVRLETESLTILYDQPTQDQLLDEALARLANVGRLDREDPEWFGQIVGHLPMGTRLFNSIMEKIIIYRHEKKGALGLSNQVIYPFHNPAVREAIFKPEQITMLQAGSPDPATAALIFMAGCWGAPHPWNLSKSEKNLYDRRWQSLFGDYWGWYDKTDPTEPIQGITADLRYAIADLAISWATMR